MEQDLTQFDRDGEWKTRPLDNAMVSLDQAEDYLYGDLPELHKQDAPLRGENLILFWENIWGQDTRCPCGKNTIARCRERACRKTKKTGRTGEYIDQQWLDEWDKANRMGQGNVSKRKSRKRKSRKRKTRKRKTRKRKLITKRRKKHRK